jgi:hypothetical protein
MSSERGAIVRYHEGVVWAAVLVGIPAWAAHLVFEAAMVRFTTTHPGWEWTLHAATIVTALVTLAGMAICYDLLRHAGRAEGAGPAETDVVSSAEDDDISPAGMSRFLGVLGLLIGAVNLALILSEGSYVLLVRHGG